MTSHAAIWTTPDRPDLSPGPEAARALAGLRDAVDARLDTTLRGASGLLGPALRHALLAPGKRVRPLMVYLLAAPRTEAEIGAALDLGAAVEMVHTASLILDDLPCMDDAQMRRSRPTTHVAFGQSTAILGAIALLSRAFGLVADLEAVPADLRTRLAAVLSRAVGWEGLVAGQMLDLAGGPAPVETVHALKTGSLFLVAVEMGSLLRGADRRQTEAARRFAHHFGLAFQSADDLIDRRQGAAEAGKDTGQDGRLGRPVLDDVAAEQALADHLALAHRALCDCGADGPVVRALLARVSLRP